MKFKTVGTIIQNVTIKTDLEPPYNNRILVAPYNTSISFERQINLKLTEEFVIILEGYTPSVLQTMPDGRIIPKKKTIKLVRFIIEGREADIYGSGVEILTLVVTSEKIYHIESLISEAKNYKEDLTLKLTKLGFEEEPLLYKLMFNLINMAEEALDEGELVSAENYAKEAISLAKELNDKLDLLESLQKNIEESSEKLKREYDVALAKGELDRAITIAELSTITAPKIVKLNWIFVATTIIFAATTAILLIYLSLILISEPTRPRLISYAVFCLKKKNIP